VHGSFDAHGITNIALNEFVLRMFHNGIQVREVSGVGQSSSSHFQLHGVEVLRAGAVSSWEGRAVHLSFYLPDSVQFGARAATRADYCWEQIESQLGYSWKPLTGQRG
jgi:hypothetical protein